ncbi:glycoside hydrolase family 10 protein [Pseudozobellia thermophila]|uniref:Uncharacterized lipoprotein YddW, UPF0748 family n=1 Tax=Pseudozobellia thermophila TaxID=192903 RepID=A0A1M6IZB1_9FLAO|nr:family 10 glycosylhydrolase [Pseudozobellia thermophila]SHJ39828.1 Uncharacterized lipoprotein YddW, UPF0748 family [Pseudozobellia thermophila]
MVKKHFLLLLLSALLGSCSVLQPISEPRREFRGFWVATVVNIDWPKSGQDPIEKQKADYLKLLDFYQDLNFNAAIVQVRTAGDAFYESQYAPWSRYLTGKEGKAPDPSAFDMGKGESMLAWMIDQTHQRGMEFHAWLNPYRATFDLKTETLSADHDFNKHPDWMVRYGKKYYYNPGLPEVQEHMASIVGELVDNYNIDAVHYDDYFYPYTIKDEVFNDSLAYNTYRLPGQDLGDWRRGNMDSLIKKSYRAIKRSKPWVQFGVSPFGVWKNKATDPKGSDTQAGQTTYENLYADPLLWMEKGWLDYIVPQIYWSMDLPVASHRKLLDWWAENTKRTNLYIGNGPYKIKNNSDEAWNKKKELPDQISYARANEKVQGNVFFSAKSLMLQKKGFVKYLRRNYYKYPVLSPLSATPNFTPFTEPELKGIEREGRSVQLRFDQLDDVRSVVFYRSKKELQPFYRPKKMVAKIVVGEENTLVLPPEALKGTKHLAYAFIDKYGKESEPKILHLKQS